MIALVGTTRHYAPQELLGRGLTACSVQYFASDMGAHWQLGHEQCEDCYSIRNQECRKRLCWWTPGQRWSRRLSS